MRNQDWIVQPRKSELPPIKRSDGPEASVALFVWVGLIVFLLIGSPLGDPLDRNYGFAIALIVVAGVSALAGAFAAYVWREVARESWLSKENAERRRRLEQIDFKEQQEATRTTEEVRRLCATANENLGELDRFARAAETCLDRAAYEFSQRAYSPFWEEIKGATENLGRIRIGVEKTEAFARRYSEALAERDHTFPRDIPLEGLVPNVASALRRLRRLVRKGQTDIDFALVWEHHKGQAILLEGFGALREAVYDVGSRIEDSMLSLEHRIASSAATSGNRLSESMRGNTDRLSESLRESLQDIRQAIKEDGAT